VALIARGPYLLLEILHFASEVKELRELEDKKDFTSGDSVKPAEVRMAERLIGDMTTKWNPSVYKDTYRADVMKRVKAKVKAGKATEITAPEAEEVEGGESGNVLDLMPLLKKSLNGKKKKSSRRRSS
jgi:DNA end-binding protein Ku